MRWYDASPIIPPSQWDFERAYVAGLLEAHSGKPTAAAKHADMDPKNFSDKIARYGLRRNGAGESGESGSRAT